MLKKTFHFLNLNSKFFITEKVYNRQISAPILKRKSSRFGLGQFLSGSNNANTANVASTNIGHAQHHLQISSAPHSHLHSHTHSQIVHHHIHHLHHPMHSTQPPLHTSSAGTTPTTPNLLSEKQYQSGPTFSNFMGAQGRS